MTRKITFTAVFAAIYVMLTVLNPLGYGFIQFRISEILLILPFWDKRFILPSLIGVAIANMFSPLGFIDVFVGLTIGVIAYYIIIKLTNVWFDCLLYSLVCGVLVGIELNIIYGLPIIFNIMSVTLSQIVVCSIGIIVNNKLQKIGVIGGSK